MGTLYKYELRKILQRKISWITSAALIFGLLIWGTASAVLPVHREYSDTAINGFTANNMEREAANQIAGRKIDQTLIDEMRPKYEAFIFDGDYMQALPYLDIYNFMGDVLGTHASAEILECSSADFYKYLNDYLEENTPPEMDNQTSSGEMILYNGYFDGWRTLSFMMKFICCMEIMFIAISLSSVFTVEHIRKTDQLILCSHFGKRKLYAAKILAGLTVGICFSLILSAIMFAIVGLLYGFDGYNTILQFILLRPIPLSIGQAALILVALSFVGAALVSLFTMMLSEVTKNSTATVGIISGVLIVTMFITEMPANLKILAEIWYMLPSNLVSLNGAFRHSILKAGEHSLFAYQYAPFVYLILMIIFYFVGKYTYNRYQIEGR